MKIRSRLASRVLSAGVIATARTLFATCHYRFTAPDPRWQLDYPAVEHGDDERFILCVWHDSLMMPALMTPPYTRKIGCCLISRHQDGGYLSDMMHALGCQTVRGSTSKGGAAALRQLLRDTEGMHIIITPDGPRGPRRVLKPGPVYLASHSGRKILPSRYVCSRSWSLPGSWTEMTIPKPFSTLTAICGEPITIPPDLTREDLEHYVGVVQQAMDALHADQLPSSNRVLTKEPLPRAA